jgi:hypothetical protein
VLGELGCEPVFPMSVDRRVFSDRGGGGGAAFPFCPPPFATLPADADRRWLLWLGDSPAWGSGDEGATPWGGGEASVLCFLGRRCVNSCK